VGLFEDMCYNSGPLISPSHFREFLMPSYKRFVAFLKDHTVRHVMVDSDGNVWKLIPLMVECGVTGMWPLEVQAGMNVVDVRQSFPAFRMWGGLDKRILAGTRADIDREIDTKLPAILPLGGYIPTIDHLIPPDCTWENFRYYIGKWRTVVEKYSRRAKIGGT
jgi:uroporphyrinogen-III decarboxylase